MKMLHSALHIAGPTLVHHHNESEDVRAFCLDVIARFLMRDWGCVDREDWESNDRSTGYLLGAYEVPPTLGLGEDHLWVEGHIQGRVEGKFLVSAAVVLPSER